MVIFVLAPFVYGSHPLVSHLYNSFDYLSKKKEEARDQRWQESCIRVSKGKENKRFVCKMYYG